MTMSTYGRSLLGAAIALRGALERTADAFAAPRLATLLESEAGLAAALAVLPSDDQGLGGDRDRILHELALARQQLERCRRLGASLSQTVTQALGGPGDYGPDGRHVADPADRAAARLLTRG